MEPSLNSILFYQYFMWTKVSIPKHILIMSKLIVVIENINNQVHWPLDLIRELTANVRANVYKVILMTPRR